uniref:BESS domain-containing protein n=1 Tax=Meloidogyne incognita TaxID=6306 RepID=A0A914KZB7_MELIC
MIRRGFVGDSKVTKNQQRGRSKLNINCNNKLSKIKKFDIASFCMNGNNNSNNVEDKAYLEDIETATMLDEDEDEDCLFARLVVARLKKFNPKKRREMRSRIHNWLDQEEDKIEMATIGERKEVDAAQSNEDNNDDLIRL